jgi:hypothetical protein
LDEAVKLRILVRAGDGRTESEMMWASPEESGEPGMFRLQNHALLVALAAGDVVRAEPAGDGILQVVDIVLPADAVLTLVGRVWDAELDVDEVTSRWQSAGARRTESLAGALATVWANGMSSRDALEVMRPELDAGSLELLEVSLPEHRTREALADDVIFELDGSARHG